MAGSRLEKFGSVFTRSGDNVWLWQVGAREESLGIREKVEGEFGEGGKSPLPVSRMVVHMHRLLLRQTRERLQLLEIQSHALKTLEELSRVRDLLRSGVLKESEKPIWFEVYATFPPKREPIHRKLRERLGKAQDPVQDIFYQEDVIRAKFYKVYGNGPRAFDLERSNFVSVSQRFVEKYQDLEAQGENDEENLFEGASRALLAEGIILRRWAGTKISSKSLLRDGETVPHDSALDVKLQDMPKEEETEKTSHPQ